MNCKAIVLLLCACSALRLRGVHDEDQRYVADAQGAWKCLRSDKMIRFDQINDDHCDCPDGSDEPGTSACSGVKLGDPRRFYCENKGHFPEYINNALVDDGVCDYDVCCDGSDETGLAHVITCPNRCAEVHQEWVAKEKARKKALKKGLDTKARLLDQASQARELLVRNIAKLEEDVRDLQVQVQSKEATKRDLESQVAQNGGAQDEPEQLKAARSQVDHLKSQTTELEAYLSLVELQYDQADKVLSDLKANYNPNFNDPAVKAAVRAQEDLAASAPDKKDSSLSELTAGLSKLSELLNEISIEERGCVRSMYGSLIQWLVDQHILSASFLGSETSKNKNSGALSQRLTKAQNEFKDMEHKLQVKLDQVELEKADLTKDYGEGDVFRALKDVCVEKDLGDYHYELCFYGKMEQTERSGHKSLLGYMTELKQQASGGLTVLEYEDGAQCWNGPKRRATVEVRCGAANELVGVSEPQRCAYAFKILSPAVCKGEPESRAHDEL